MLTLPLAQQGHSGTLPQVGLATADRVQFGEKQHQIRLLDPKKVLFPLLHL